MGYSDAAGNGGGRGEPGTPMGNSSYQRQAPQGGREGVEASDWQGGAGTMIWHPEKFFSEEWKKMEKKQPKHKKG